VIFPPFTSNDNISNKHTVILSFILRRYATNTLNITLYNFSF